MGNEKGQGWWTNEGGVARREWRLFGLHLLQYFPSDIQGRVNVIARRLRLNCVGDCVEWEL